jgi:formylmethanofuran dehydrogenase subunit C
MVGGELLIDGDAGAEVGVTMRRGLIAVGGRVGDFVGGGMIAGTVVVFGGCGRRPGAGMKRGTLALLGEAPTLLPTFADAGPYDGLFLELYLRHLRGLGFGPAAAARPRLRRWCGDRVSLGKGEILTREA